jgi:outer membrane protein TolC
MRFDPQGIGLVEAVTLALQHDADLKLREADVQRASGVEQEERGLFDASFLTTAQYEYRIQELTENRKENERAKRERAREQLDRDRVRAEGGRALVGQLQRVRDAPPGSDQVPLLTQISPSLGAQVEVIDALIAAATDPQQRATLVNVRNTLLDNSIQEAQSDLATIVQEFDDSQARVDNLGAAPIDEVFYNGRLSLQLAKLFRNGISVTPFFDGSIEGTNFRDKPRSEDFGGKGLQDLFTFHSGVGLVLPLMQGRGRTAVAAREQAAQLDLDASRLTLEHERSRSAFDTVTAYWALRGEQEALDVANRSLTLRTQIVDLTRALIQAGDLPAVELSRAQAGESRARAQVEDSRRRLHDARVTLASALGIAVTADDETLPLARDGFPDLSGAAEAMKQGVGTWTASAPDARRDVAAAQRAGEAGEALRLGALNGTRSRLDLSTSLYYTALEERSIARAIDRWVGPSTDAQLEFEKPLGNNRARGVLEQVSASARSRQVLAVDARRQVGLGVVRAANALPEALARVREAENGVRAATAILDAELERLKEGDVSVLQATVTEQQAAEAALTLVLARQELAQILAQLRYETGTLVTGTTVEMSNFVTLPPSR